MPKDLQTLCELDNENPTKYAMVYRLEAFIYMTFWKLDKDKCNLEAVEDLRMIFKDLMFNRALIVERKEIPDSKFGFLLQFASGLGRIDGFSLNHTLFDLKLTQGATAPAPEKCPICKGEPDLTQEHIKSHDYLVWIFYGCHSTFNFENCKIPLSADMHKEIMTDKLYGLSQLRKENAKQWKQQSKPFKW